ncbi:hypothetical protein FKV24_007005 [Lysobacter maris]|uniref:Uncharacterized protein n=1 Tax=Marilutibacter maris TaxID=1605891 RepID=A0A508AXD4_9GAMM|nr:hypothetical protein FKV24_007005 [Lysobacter maris]
MSAPPAEAYSAPVAADIADAVEAGDVEATGAAQATAVEHDAAALDRIEVTGNRIRGAGGDVGAIPLHEDRSLAPADWLERIRARRAAGDSDTARESLELFRKAHPHVRLPDDLLELLETADTDAAGTP